MQKLRKLWCTVRWRRYWRAYEALRMRYYWQCWRRQFSTVFI